MARKANARTPRAKKPKILKSGFDLPQAAAPLRVGDMLSRTEVIKPGKERWAVKTGTDDDVGNVKPARVPTTVEALIALPRPHDMQPPDRDFPGYVRKRADPVELTIFEVVATIVGCKMEVDGDFHIVIQGDSGPAATMIVEIPDPDPAFVSNKSPWFAAIKTARDTAQAKLHIAAPSAAVAEVPLQRVSVRARIVGVGFFDRIHGQDGVARMNGIELHPVLGVQWA